MGVILMTKGRKKVTSYVSVSKAVCSKKKSSQAYYR